MAYTALVSLWYEPLAMDKTHSNS